MMSCAPAVVLPQGLAFPRSGCQLPLVRGTAAALPEEGVSLSMYEPTLSLGMLFFDPNHPDWAC